MLQQPQLAVRGRVPYMVMKETVTRALYLCGSPTYCDALRPTSVPVRGYGQVLR